MGTSVTRSQVSLSEEVTAVFFKSRKMLKLIFFSFFIATALSAGCPGCPFEANIEDQDIADELKENALQTCHKLLSAEFNLRATNGAPVIKQIENFHTQVVAGTNYIMDVVVQYGNRELVCRRLTLYRPLPFNCDKEVCLQSVRENQVVLLEQ